MNQADKKEFEIIHNKIDILTKDIKFIKENLFNPHKGLWAETKQNTQFRQSATKWRSVVGVSVLGLIVSRAWEFITNG